MRLRWLAGGCASQTFAVAQDPALEQRWLPPGTPICHCHEEPRPAALVTPGGVYFGTH